MRLKNIIFKKIILKIKGVLLLKNITLSIAFICFFIFNIYAQEIETENNPIQTNGIDIQDSDEENTNQAVTNISDTPIDATNSAEKKKIKDKTKGLYINQNIEASIGPFNAGLNTRFYYKLSFEKENNKIFERSSLSAGLHNQATVGYNMFGVFVDYNIIKYVSINASSYYIAAYNTMDFGYIGFTNKNTDTTQSYIKSYNSENANGFMFSVNPEVRYFFNNIMLENSTKINFVTLGNDPYYFDRRTYLKHKKNDLEIISDFSMLCEIEAFKIGPIYSLTYVHGPKILAHKIGVLGYFEYYFFDDNFKIYIETKAAWNIKMPYYENTSFISGSFGVEYKII